MQQDESPTLSVYQHIGISAYLAVHWCVLSVAALLLHAIAKAKNLPLSRTTILRLILLWLAVLGGLGGGLFLVVVTWHRMGRHSLDFWLDVQLSVMLLWSMVLEVSRYFLGEDENWMKIGCSSEWRWRRCFWKLAWRIGEESFASTVVYWCCTFVNGHCISIYRHGSQIVLSGFDDSGRGYFPGVDGCLMLDKSYWRNPTLEESTSPIPKGNELPPNFRGRVFSLTCRLDIASCSSHLWVCLIRFVVSVVL